MNTTQTALPILTRRPSVAILLAGLLLTSMSACRQDPSRAADDPPPNKWNPEADFYGMVRRVHYSYIPFTSEQAMRDRADVVVEGSPIAVARGRTIGSEEGGDGHHTFVLHFSVKRALKGSPGEVVHVEFFRSRPTDIKELSKQLPIGDDVRLYLIDLKPFPQKARVFGEGEGVPHGKPLYSLTGPQGMMVKTSTGTVQPLISENWISQGITW